MSDGASVEKTTRIVTGMLVIGALVACSLWVLGPFLVACLWAILLVVSSWPLLVRLQRFLGGSRRAAVGVMTGLLLIFFVIPFVMAVSQLLRSTDGLLAIARNLGDLDVPPAPAWVSTLPVLGEQLASAWNEFVHLGARDLAVKAAPLAGKMGRWLLGELGGLGYVLLQGLLTIALAALLYLDGEHAMAQALTAGRRLGGPQGERLVRLAGQAIRGVAMGVGLTALAQTLLAAMGLAIAGVPYVPLLAAVIFVACVAQLGPLVILVPAAGWLYWQGNSGWAVALLVWCGLISTLDNFMRPLLIRRGAEELPLLLIFAGVIGGLLTFGLVGLFVGPVCLAVTWTLVEAWLRSEEN